MDGQDFPELALLRATVQNYTATIEAITPRLYTALSASENTFERQHHLKELVRDCIDLVAATDDPVQEKEVIKNLSHNVDQIIPPSPAEARALKDGEKMDEDAMLELEDMPSEKGHAQYQQQDEQNSGLREPFMRFRICDLGTDQGETEIPIYSPVSTLGELIERAVNSGKLRSSRLPDFWSKIYDTEKNRVTPSGLFWEWQEPAVPILRALWRKDRHGEWRESLIETVAIEGEYGIVVLWNEHYERGLPVRKYLNSILREYIIGEVQWPANQGKADDEFFDKHNPAFSKKTTALCAQVRMAIDSLAMPPSAKPAPTEKENDKGKATEKENDKGKGKTHDMDLDGLCSSVTEAFMEL